MSIFLIFLSFASGIGVLATFIIGLVNYFSDSNYKKWWQVSLLLFAAMSVLTLLAAVFDNESGLNTGLVFIWIYISLLMFAFILVYIIKRNRKDGTKGYKKRIAVTFTTGLAVFFIFTATAEDPGNVEREVNEATATVEETSEEETVEESISDEEKELEEERKALEAEKEEIEAERKRLEEEKSIEQKQKEEAQKESEEKEKEAELKKKEEKSAEEKSAEEKSIEEQKKAEEAEEESTEESKEEKVYEPGSEDRIPVTVASYTDGDTTRFYYNGNNEPFRYLLIDTPETSHPRVGEQPFGKEASARTKELLSNADIIEVEFDVGARQDHYQRNLAYIYADGQMVNEILVREGLAQVNYVEPPNIRYLERLETAQALAQQEQIGIWSLPHPFDSEVYQEDSSSQKSPDVSEFPAGSATPSSGGSENFQNCTELREVYPDGVASGHAAYQSKMDRDKDGYACE